MRARAKSLRAGVWWGRRHKQQWERYSEAQEEGEGGEEGSDAEVLRRVLPVCHLYPVFFPPFPSFWSWFLVCWPPLCGARRLHLNSPPVFLLTLCATPSSPCLLACLPLPCPPPPPAHLAIALPSFPGGVLLLLLLLCVAWGHTPNHNNAQQNNHEKRGWKKRYASLFFVACIDQDDNELITLEKIHLFVEVLDRYFGNVCELDIIFNFHKAYYILDELFIGGELQVGGGGGRSAAFWFCMETGVRCFCLVSS